MLFLLFTENKQLQVVTQAVRMYHPSTDCYNNPESQTSVQLWTPITMHLKQRRKSGDPRQLTPVVFSI